MAFTFGSFLQWVAMTLMFQRDTPDTLHTKYHNDNEFIVVISLVELMQGYTHR